MTKPRLLCMVNLNRCLHVLDELQEFAEVDYRSADYELLLETIANYDIFWGHVGTKVDKAVLANANRLKIVASASTGTDHIDRNAIADRGIRLISLKNDYEVLRQFTGTAECAWMHILIAMQNYRAKSARVKKGLWSTDELIGKQLSQKTLGILGVGRLGSMVAEYGKAFGMRVIGCDLKKFHIQGVKQVNHDTLYGESDVLTVHVHLTEQNYHLINAGVFEKMKQGVIFVNTSRGDVVDEKALLANLESSKIAAAGVDVVSNEWRKDMSESPMVKYYQNHNNLTITPHMGGCTVFSQNKAREYTAEKIRQAVKEIF